MFKNKPIERLCKPGEKLKSSYWFYRRWTKPALNFALRVKIWKKVFFFSIWLHHSQICIKIKIKHFFKAWKVNEFSLSHLYNLKKDWQKQHKILNTHNKFKEKKRDLLRPMRNYFTNTKRLKIIITKPIKIKNNKHKRKWHRELEDLVLCI